MADSPIEQELKAIKTITDALEPLNADSRMRALRYAMEHLGLSMPEVAQPSGASRSHGKTDVELHESNTVIPPPQNEHVIDIRTLEQQKQPNSAIEMATLVAYYLKHQAAAEERKDEITTADVEKYFVQAGFPLPTQTKFTLPNTKNAGYLETAGHGKYKLNSVGHNLVVHNMPRKADSGTPKVHAKKAKKKKAATKRKNAT